MSTAAFRAALALAALAVAFAPRPAAAQSGAGAAALEAPVHVPADAPARYHPLPPVRAQAEEMQRWVEARLERVLPALMAEYDVDMWIVSMREYGEDPVFWSMVSPTTFAASLTIAAT